MPCLDVEGDALEDEVEPRAVSHLDPRELHRSRFGPPLRARASFSVFQQSMKKNKNDTTDGRTQTKNANCEETLSRFLRRSRRCTRYITWLLQGEMLCHLFFVPPMYLATTCSITMGAVTLANEMRIRGAHSVYMYSTTHSIFSRIFFVYFFRSRRRISTAEESAPNLYRSTKYTRTSIFPSPRYIHFFRSVRHVQLARVPTTSTAYVCDFPFKEGTHSSKQQQTAGQKPDSYHAYLR